MAEMQVPSSFAKGVEEDLFFKLRGLMWHSLTEKGVLTASLSKLCGWLGEATSSPNPAAIGPPGHASVASEAQAGRLS